MSANHYNSNLSTFEELLELHNSVSIYHRNLQCLAIELYKIFNGISPDIMKDIFPLNTSYIYNIKNRERIYTRPVKSVYKGTESLSLLAPNILELIPGSIKSIDSLPAFSIAIKQWKPNYYPYRLTCSNIYALRSGFISSKFYAYIYIYIYINVHVLIY